MFDSKKVVVILGDHMIYQPSCCLILNIQGEVNALGGECLEPGREVVRNPLVMVHHHCLALHEIVH